MSFSLLVILFVVNAIITISTLSNIQNLSTHLSKVVDPSLESIIDFRTVMLESKTYTTNWVFLRFAGEDKKSLEKLHASVYPALKSTINNYAAQWQTKNWIDSLNKITAGFENLLAIEKDIMGDLKQFDDYDDPIIKFEAEREIEEEILPRTAALMSSLNTIRSHWLSVRKDGNDKLKSSSTKLRLLIIVLAIGIIFIGFFLSLYMAGKIIGPINMIRDIVNDLGKGIIKKVNHEVNNDEIGEMVQSVNNLSEKLQSSAAFASEIGKRNFNTYYVPLSSEDTLGKALIAMRDNLKQGDERLNEAQHIAHLGSFERDIKTNQVYFSDEMFRIFDIDPASFDFRFQSILQLIHPEDIKYFISAGRKYMEDHLPSAYECRIVTEKGVTKNIFIRSKVVLDAYEKVIKTVGIVQDITERKNAEEQVRLSNERYELLTKITNEMIWDWDLVNDKIFRSENYNKVFGEDEGDRNDVGKWLMQVHPDDKDWIVNYIKQKADDPGVDSWEIEFRYYRSNGEMVYLHDRGYIIRDENKKAIRMVGATTDITERKKAELQLHNSEERYRQIVETAEEGIWLIDENNNTTFVNKKMCEMLEYSQEEMIGRQNYFFKDEEEIKNATEQIERRKQGMNEMHDAKFITKSGKIVWTRVSTNPITDNLGKYIGALGMFTDITRRRLDEESLKRSEANLDIKNKELQQKNKELEQFAYVASHDLQEPLRTTSSFVELLQKQYHGRLDEKADKYLTFITQSSDRMKVLIKDLLDYSRIGNKKELNMVDCNVILHEVLADIDTAVTESQAEIKTDCLPVISGYPTELKQLFQNLIMNAVKFRKKGIAPQIKIAAQKNNGHFKFEITDNGIGIDEQHKERIFIIFQRLHTRNEYEGSGIGLAHCKKIVELHGGKIWIESAAGQGTTFHFTIPKNNNL